MATYVNNLRLKEIATGAESGTWGTSTNTNLELIGDGLGYGTKQVAADSNVTFTMPDATTDGTRAMYLKFTSAGSLTATRTLTLAPNTVSKVWIIENATTGSQTITIKQGSGATVNIASGTKKLVYTDGAGAGAAVYTGLDADTAGADIASATATDLTGATGNTVVITGTTTATSLTMNVGQQMILLPSAAWPLTYHATTMNINGGVSYTCAAGDRIYAVKDLAGVIRVSVFKQDGTAVVPGVAASVAVGDITGAGTGVLTALAVNVGSAGAPVVLDGALGTPSGGTLTNATGLPISTGVSGLGTNVGTFLGTPSSANFASAITDETGTGVAVFNLSPDLTTPKITTGLQDSSANSVIPFDTNQFFSGTFSDQVTAIGNTGTAKTLDLNDGNVFTATLNGNVTFTLATPNGVSNRASSFTLILTNDATPSRTVAWAGGSFKWPGGAAALARTTTASAVDVWVFFTVDGGTTYYGNISQKNLTA